MANIRLQHRRSSTGSRERLRQQFTRSVPLRQIYPQFAEVRIELEFRSDGRTTPSAQSFAYFPAARGFFRYACPCHSCDGDFDLSQQVAELAVTGRDERCSRSVEVACVGERAGDAEQRAACAVVARARLSAVMRSPEAAS